MTPGRRVRLPSVFGWRYAHGGDGRRIVVRDHGRPGAPRLEERRWRWWNPLHLVVAAVGVYERWRYW